MLSSLSAGSFQQLSSLFEWFILNLSSFSKLLLVALICLCQLLLQLFPEIVTFLLADSELGQGVSWSFSVRSSLKWHWTLCNGQKILASALSCLFWACRLYEIEKISLSLFFRELLVKKANHLLFSFNLLLCYLEVCL